MELKIGDIFTLRNGSVWQIIELDESMYYNVECKHLFGPVSPHCLLSPDNTEEFTSNLELYTKEEWNNPENEEERLLLCFDKFITPDKNPEYFL